jgi:hypothetical protein
MSAPSFFDWDWGEGGFKLLKHNGDTGRRSHLFEEYTARTVAAGRSAARLIRFSSFVCIFL